MPSLIAPAEEAAIVSLCNRYTDAVNRRDWGRYRDCWASNGIWDLGAPVSQRKDGIEAIMAEVQRAVGAMDLFVQMNHAPTVLTVAGRHATARSTLNEIGRVRPDARELLDGAEGLFILALYDDELVKQDDDRWRFARRTYQVVLFDGAAPRGSVQHVS